MTITKDLRSGKSKKLRLLWLLLLVLSFVRATLSPAETTSDRIDFYFGDWHASTPRTTQGSLQQWDIFTRGDAMNPVKKGAVLRYIHSYTYATLAAHAS